MLKIIGTALLALCLILAPAAAVAGSGSTCDYKADPTCTVWGSDNGDGSAPGSDGGGCTWDGQPMPCTDRAFGWYMGGGCYWKALEPAPGVRPPGGQDPAKGAWGIQSCYLSYGSPYATQVDYWMPAPATGPNPLLLAERALAKIRLLGARIGIAPSPAGSGLVGLPVWLWTAVTPGTWGPLSASATDGGITVQVSARADRIVWDMGDGHRVSCANPGTPYRAADADAASPTCGYVYTTPSVTPARPGGRFTVTATTYWTVTWAGGGESGVLGPTSRSQTTVRIAELQVVSRQPSQRTASDAAHSSESIWTRPR